MKILVSADMEGATGVTWPADCEPGTEQWQRCRAMFTSDVNAAVAGFLDGGADEVVVNEAHSTMRNLLLEELDERATMLTGRHKDLTMVEGVQHGDVDGVVFLGYHTGAGTEGVLAHTYLPNSITGVWVDGHPASEGYLNAIVCAEYGVPVVLVTGDDRTCEDAEGVRPEARTVAVKDYVSRYAAICRPPARTDADIRDAAREAVALAQRHDAAADGPFVVEVEVDATQLVTNACVVPGGGAVGERRVRYAAPSGYEMIRTFKVVTTLIANAVERTMADPAARGRRAGLGPDPDRHHQPRRRRLRRAPGRRVRRRAARRGRPRAAPARVGAGTHERGRPGPRHRPGRDRALLVHGHLDVVPADPARVVGAPRSPARSATAGCGAAARST